MRVKCLAQERNTMSPVRAQTRTAHLVLPHFSPTLTFFPCPQLPRAWNRLI